MFNIGKILSGVVFGLTFVALSILAVSRGDLELFHFIATNSSCCFSFQVKYEVGPDKEPSLQIYQAANAFGNSMEKTRFIFADIRE